MTSLSEPYGKCADVNAVPVSECQLNCKTEKVVKTCGCHDLYMGSDHYTSDNGKSVTVVYCGVSQFLHEHRSFFIS